MKKVTLSLLILFAGILSFTACNTPSTTNNTTNVIMPNSNTDSITKSYKEKTQAVYDAIQSGDLSKLGDIIDSNVIEHSSMMPNGTDTGLEKVSKKQMASLKAAFPDLKIEMLHFCADSEFIYSHFRMTGTNTGSMMGMAPTGKKIDFTGIDMVRIKNGKAVEHWDYSDNTTFMKQMGMMSPPPGSDDKMKAGK